MLTRFTFALGILLIAAAVVWKVVIAPQNDARFPDGWSWEMNTIGYTSYADENGEFPEGTSLEDDPINLTTRTVSASKTNAEQVTITDRYEVRDASTNAVEWEFETTGLVNSKSGQWVESGDYYFLPRSVDRSKTYVVTNSTFQNLPVSFQREEQVVGINTYLFAFYGNLTNLNGYPDQPLEEGQTITCFDFQLEYWVEPTTGEIMKYREWCEGDWVVDTATGERLLGLSRWGGETAGDDLIRQAGIIRSELTANNMNDLYIPLALGLIGVIALMFGIFSVKQTSAKVAA